MLSGDKAMDDKELLWKKLSKGLTEQIQAVVKDYHGEEEPYRSVFEKEYDKVIFSDYFRALSDKTQVVPLSEQDHNHNRLTHSLEVASVGRSLGTKLYNSLIQVVGQDSAESEDLKYIPTIIETACLLHDIGNPPFGHAGEDAIKHVFKLLFQEKDDDNFYTYKNLKLKEKQKLDFISFDGNANGFRIATRLAGKRKNIIKPDDNTVRLGSGLGLSNITLAAGLKYPFSAGGHPEKDKYGYFQSESKIFLWVSKLLPPDEDNQRTSQNWHKRHPLVYLVEAADDICNLVMDFEDAIKNGHAETKRLTEDVLSKIFDIDNTDIFNIFSLKPRQEPPDEYTHLFLTKLGIEGKNKELKSRELIKNIIQIKDYDSNKPISQENLKAIEGIRAEVIGMLIRSVFKTFEDNLNSILKGTLCHTDPRKTESGPKEVGLLDKYFGSLDRRYTAIEEIKKVYLVNSLYCHERKAAIEVSGYHITECLLLLFLDSVSEFRDKKSFKDCCTRTQHLLRYLGYTQDCQHEKDDYDACLKVIDFYTKASDREISMLYQKLLGYKY